MSNGKGDNPVCRQRQLDDILELSRGLVSMAQQGEWQRVMELERLRRDRLLRCFACSVSVAEAALVATAIRRIAEYDLSLNNLVREARASVAAELQRLRNGQRAVRAYNEPF